MINLDLNIFIAKTWRKQLSCVVFVVSFILSRPNKSPTKVEMTSEKCSEMAEKFRETGNASFLNGEFQDALLLYNKSLCHAIKPEELSLAYANRSAVYLKVKMYDKCLENINLSRDHGYDISKLPKLREREEKCRKFMKAHQTDSRNDPWSFFKLSHPANEKIPFIINSLEHREDNKFGRYLVTTSDLKTGDVIAIEEPFYKFIDKEFCYSRCTNCLKSNDLSLTPCSRCSDSEFLFHRFPVCAVLL